MSIKKTAFLAALVVAFTSMVLLAKAPATGSKAPEFTLTNVDGKNVSLSQYKGKYVVLEWVNHGCPFVVKHYDSGNMQKLQKDLTGKGVVWLSVASSAEGKEGYMGPAEWKDALKDKKSAATDTLLDANGKVGKAYDAKTTPHMFVIDPKGTLIYAGAIDDKPTYKQSDVKGAKNYVRAALDESMAGKPVTTASTESYGCSVKYAK